MAQGRDEHRMVFDIRGRRGVAIKIVYAILALLMVASLFLVTGAINLNTLFGSSSTGESAVSNFQKQSAKIEAKLKKEPENEDLLASLTRTRINTGTAMINAGAGESQSGVEEYKQELAQASEDWSKYLKAAKEPSAGLAIQAAPALFQLAELSSGGEQARENVIAATEAQKIVSEQRPNLNSYSTLSLYTLFTGDFKAAEEAEQKAIKLTSNKFEREQFENKFEETEKSARTFDKQLKLEKASKKSEAAGEGGESNALEKPSLGGLGATGLGG